VLRPPFAPRGPPAGGAPAGGGGGAPWGAPSPGVALPPPPPPRLLDARDRKGLLETNVWAGSVRSLSWWLDELEGAGASWVVLVAAGPRDRVELIAEHALRNARPRT
jgi:hypothetical protein